MKLIPTYIDGDFYGHITMEELLRLRKKKYELAWDLQREQQADHMLYCHYDYDIEDDDVITTAWLYSGYPMTNAEFDRVANFKYSFIGAIHKH